MSERFGVLIAGGGVAALEALLALREMAGERCEITLLAPDPEFHYPPLSVTEPFELATPRRLELMSVAVEQRAMFHRAALAEVDAERRTLLTDEGRELAYDALLIAIGARPLEAVPGALTFGGSENAELFRGLLAELDSGAVRRVTFAVPDEAGWPLGLYELALLTAAHVHERELPDVRLELVTSEPRPLGVFGDRASDAVGELLAEAGVHVRLSAAPSSFDGTHLELARAAPIACDRVVSLPRLEVPPIAGIPQGEHGYIPTNTFCRILGHERLFAAGDATWFPVKQGGIATQQADCAASAIAELSGAPVTPRPFRPVLRGALLTGWGPRYLRASLGSVGERHEGSIATRSTLWWPPAKVAGRLLAPYLASKAGHPIPRAGDLADLRPPFGDDATEVGREHTDIVASALSAADIDAREQDYRGALRWLEVAEDLDLFLPPSYERKRIFWRELAGER